MYQNKILNGALLSKKILRELELRISSLERKPKLAVILVGNDYASEVYVRNKKIACENIKIDTNSYHLPETISELELLNLIDKLNKEVLVDGILVQLPLPSHINTNQVINNINSFKDVDGFHRYNMGSLAVNDPILSPCTPKGIIELLQSINFEFLGAKVTIVGSSNIVGRPMALELLNRGSTVTVCNSKTKNLKDMCQRSDLLISATGVAKLIKSDWVKPNAVIIDVGITRLENNKVCGDVDFDDVIDKVSYITPVPGGIGPMTIAMLLKNVLICYELNRKV